MDGFRVFTWNKKTFPNPKKLTADLGRQGLRVVTIVDPGVKVDTRYRIYAEGRANRRFICQPDGEEYNGNVWPGLSAFPDFHNAETRDWWAGLVQRWLADTGLSGLWNDMNEPAATDVNGKLMEAQHAGGHVPHTTARNTYAMQMARATYEGMLAQNPAGRPFILTRAAFSGAQTVAALWAGDNSSQWEHLAASLPMLMNLGLSGMPFVGADIGGFVDNADGELLARWTQAGAFYPFCRNHSATGTRAQEPWAFGPEVEAICRRSIELRYQLLPYFYQLFHQAAETGAPVMRPMVWHYPQDPATFNLNDQFMLGPDLLVAPVLAPGVEARAVYLPEGPWYRWGRGHTTPLHGPGDLVASAPLEEMPLFVRGGAILPMWNLAQHTGAIDRASLRLHIWPGKGHLAFYEDDGATQAQAQTQGAAGYRQTPFTVHVEKNRLFIHWDAPFGDYGDARKRWNFVVHAWPSTKATLDGQPVALRQQADTLTLSVKDDRQKHTLVISKA
jgi:alpha-glucosidase